MTESTPDPELDELVAAHLDGETTPEERARIEGDPRLLARLEEMRVVSDLVAEPVVLPEAAVRDAHIAAALAASATSPVVTALPSRRNRPGVVRFASAAAAVLAILIAVPVLLADSDDDEDMATEAFAADETAAETAVAARDGSPDRDAGDAGTAGVEVEADAEAPAAPAPAADEAPASAEMATSGDADMDDADMDDADEGKEAEAVAVEQPADGNASTADAVRIDIGRVASPQALRREVEARLAAGSGTTGDDGAGDGDASVGLICGPAIAEVIAGTGPATAFGAVMLFNAMSEYVVLSDPSQPVILFETSTCTVQSGG